MAETRAFEAHTGKLPTCIFRHWHVVNETRSETRGNPNRNVAVAEPGHLAIQASENAATYRPCRPSTKPFTQAPAFGRFRSWCGAARRRQRAGGGVGPARVTTSPGRGKKPYPSLGDLRTARSHCHTGRRTGAGTRAIRSHVPRKASQNQRLPATPPSTRLSHNKL
jgi:hypothetical protein